ncbi:hypothetical protein Q4Q34_06215 [Flavivirga abyssicola]|uniref:hypothetical protein n=1 Tax=Flavivirga abyssicola TaxID=3063533 RepID=UPI0026E0E4F1|nr:hypothetical protein [Flavivirga sp. MEBiC07777]WVK14623.1 hypothetical protein Q4Q34_06215 [Flavivirga sp. MEBiC07777]
MKTINILALVLFAMLFTANVNAQKNNKTYYYFTQATAHIPNNGGNNAIITIVKEITCDSTPLPISGIRLGVERQTRDHVKTEYNWDNFIIKSYTYFSTKAEAEEKRALTIGKYERKRYKVIKDINFEYHCDEN